MATGQDRFAGYSRTQYYRRVDLLAKAGLIQPQRGVHNEILLSEREKSVLRQFLTIEKKHEKLTMEGRLLALKASLLEHERNDLQMQSDYLRAENRTLRKALVKYRRWTLQRILGRIRRWFSARARS